MMGEQARQTAYSLSMASRSAISSGDVSTLQLMGHSLLKSRNVLFVGFYNQRGKIIALAERSPVSKADLAFLSSVDVASLTKVHRDTTTPFGDCLEVCQPVLSQESAGKSRLIGYVSVGVSPQQEQSQVQRVNYFAHRIRLHYRYIITLPATCFLITSALFPDPAIGRCDRRIAAGDLDTAVAMDRADAIGDLARSFNAMIQTVKRQQQDLIEINDGLEQKVVQRTAQLETANQRLSSEIAEKEDFLRAVSHDLNAPLRNISGMAAMLLMKHRDRFDDEIIHRLQRIQKNVDVETGSDFRIAGTFADQNPPRKNADDRDIRSHFRDRGDV